MKDQNQLTQDRLFESVLKVSRMSYLPKSQFRPIASADLPRMSLLYQRNVDNSDSNTIFITWTRESVSV